MTTVEQIILQSAAIHPDWTPEDHLSYLLNDAFVNTTRAEVQHYVDVLRAAGRI